MKIITPGHEYALKDHEGEGTQVLQFIKKVTVEGGGLKTEKDGTTNEEVLAMLVDRLQYLNGIMKCHENDMAIASLENALAWLERRSKDRIHRGVEGTNEK